MFVHHSVVFRSSSMNKINKLALSAALTLGFAHFASAAPILDDVLSSYPDVRDNHGAYVQLTDTDGEKDDIVAGLILENAGFAANNSFGLFKRGDFTNQFEVFAGSDTPSSDRVTLVFKDNGSVWADGVEKAADFGTLFGFYLKRGDSIWYSDKSLNGGIDVAGFYDLPNAKNGYDFVVAFEDVPNGDQDFNDLVVGLSDVATVTEPGSLALLGLGLIGLGLSRNRKS
ncbi:PEP-CTERM sorting domain-containing protein [Hydrocarboniclastica marina]|uniref:PEP-CTERM sorting domain-containing protein n=2 Tax=Hydrocarboniclastica marina TaxID=2259620 RepID=A0A4P7XHQ8_9ALTE|nr:PEP-CTERM sorting domain-containing protein [Hydrocarboniclastica marina]